MHASVLCVGEEVSFWELAERAADRGVGLLIGWRRLPREEAGSKRQEARLWRDIARPRAAESLSMGVDPRDNEAPEINPADKSIKLGWRIDDLLVVLQVSPSLSLEPDHV